MIRQIYPIIFILLGILLTACDDFEEPGGKNSVIDGNMIEVSIATSIPAVTIQTRAGASPAEKKLNYVDVLVFKEDNEGEKFAYRTSHTNNLADLDYDSNIFITTKLKLSDGEEKYRIVFLANMKEELDDFFGSDEEDYVGELKNDLLKQIIVRQDGKWNTNTALPMWGESSNTTAIKKTTNSDAFGSIDLLRSVARIVLSVNVDNDTNGAELFEIKEVKVYNARNKGLAVPDPDKLESGKATSPSLVQDAGIIPADQMAYTLTSSDDNKLSGIYINEAAAGSVYLSIKAIYKGDDSGNTKPTYYKVGFYNPSDEPVDILRNVTYNMTIIGVSAPGGEEEGDASINDLTVAMTDWSDGEMKHVVFNGQNYLAVSESTLEVSRPEDTHQILVQTNYSKGWEAEVLEGGEWISDLQPILYTPQDPDLEPKTPFSFTVSENDGGVDREGVIRFSCGDNHLALDVHIKQSTKIVYTLKIMINDPDDPTEFIDFDRVITFPSGYHYGDNEDITPRTLKIEWTPDDIPLNLEFNPYFAWGEDMQKESIHTGGQTTFEVVPKKLSERSQEEWYPEAVGDIQIQIGDESTTQQNVLIRRIHHEVYIEKADRYIIEDENDIHQFKLFSNTKWEAVSATTFSDGEDVALILGKTNGDFNLTGAEPGEDIDFKLPTSVLSRNFAGIIPLTIEFEDVDGRKFTKDYEFDIYHSNELPGSDTKFGGKANCYVLHTSDNNGSKPYKVSIPVSQANESEWNRKNNEITPGLQLSPKFIWTDNNNGYGEDNSTVKNMVIEGEGPDARLIVTAGTTPGNAVVAVVTEGTEKIHWSWHIWVVDDVNFDPDDDDHDWPGFRYFQFMDRNLGALSANPLVPESHGLYYQWGRKDPFSVSNTGSNMRGENGSVLWDPWKPGSNEIINPQVAFDRSIAYPYQIITPSSTTNWLSSTWTAGLGDDFWNVMENGSLSTSKKGIFDPCPDGWKTIPGGRNIANEWTMLFGLIEYDSNGNFSWVSTVNAGKWPHTGYINHNTDNLTAANEGRYWTATNNEFGVAYHFRFEATSRHPSESFNKTSALPVRCMRRTESLMQD